MVSSQPNMYAAIALPSVRVRLGHSDGVVPNFPYGPEPLNSSPKPASSRIEYVLASVILLDAMGCPVVESAMDVRTVL